jgi:hypothetical protein
VHLLSKREERKAEPKRPSVIIQAGAATDYKMNDRSKRILENREKRLKEWTITK